MMMNTAHAHERRMGEWAMARSVDTPEAIAIDGWMDGRTDGQGGMMGQTPKRIAIALPSC